MKQMFQVRPPRALDPTAVHAATAATAPGTPAFRAAPRRATHAHLSTRQDAAKFNQPLSFDTSRITTMDRMFKVPPAHALTSSLESGPPPALCHPISWAVARRATRARLSTRQGASAFNQALSFDTSKTTNMNNMFAVRSARALSPTALSRSLPVHAACAVASAVPLPARSSPGTVCCPPCDRTRNLCPPPTNCSSVARGRATRPSRLTGNMAQAGLREAALITVSRRPRRRRLRPRHLRRHRRRRRPPRRRRLPRQAHRRHRKRGLLP